MSFIALIAAIVFGAITITSNDADGKEITTAFLVGLLHQKLFKDLQNLRK